MNRDSQRLELVQNIQVFFGFANFYQCFFQSFSQIVAPFIFMLRTITIKPLIKDLVFVNKGNTIDELGSSISKVSRARFKNIVMPSFSN